MTTPRKLTVAQHLEQGRSWIQALLSYWLTRSNLSTYKLHAISAWGLGEKSTLDKSVTCRIIRSGRSVSTQNLFALEAANRAIHLWHTKGADGAREILGPQSAWNVRAEWLDDAIWLPLPEDPAHPLELVDFFEVVIGRLRLPYLGEALNPLEAHQRQAERLCALLNDALTATGQPPRDAIRAMLAAYPSQDQYRQQRLRQVVLGDLMLTPDELEEELFALAEVLRVLRSLPLGTYGPDQLRTELAD